MKNPSVAKLAKAAGSPIKQDPTKIGTEESLVKPKKRSFDEAYEKRDMKLYGGLNKADYIKEAKRQKSVKESKVLKKGGTYDVPKKPMISKSGGAKTSVGTTQVKKTDVKKTDVKKTDTKKTTKTVAESKTKKKFKDTKAGKFLSKVVGDGSKRKAYEANKKKRQNRSVTGRMKAKASKFGRMGT